MFAFVFGAEAKAGNEKRLRVSMKIGRTVKMIVNNQGSSGFRVANRGGASLDSLGTW